LLTVAKNTIGIWLILAVLALPFPYFLIKPLFDSPSDALFSFYISGLLIFPSLLFGFIQYRMKNSTIEALSYTTIAYLLTYFLIKYGSDKLLLRQFYTPESNILSSPVGSLSKDILFWTSMGTSNIYNFFMGVTEIIPGLLLMHRKTRILGAFIALGVLTNVFFINIGFDISVKLLSFLLMASAFYLLLPSLKQLIDLFVRHRNVEQLETPHLSFKKSLLKRLIKALILSLIIIDVVVPYLQPQSVQETRIEELSGCYEANSSRQFLGHSIKRIHIHSKGYLITEDLNGEFYDYAMSYIGNTIHVLKENFNLHVNPCDGLISWKEMKFKKIDLKPALLKDDLHWTVEGMIKN